MQTLQGQVDAWLASKPSGVFGEYDAGPPELYFFRLRFFQETPDEWGLLVGDLAHNARSALDHLAWQVVLHGGGSPDERTGFPIVLNQSDWLSQATKLRGALPDHIALVEGRQPYHRRDLQGAQTIQAAMDHPLAILAFLNNEDSTAFSTRHQRRFGPLATTLSLSAILPLSICTEARSLGTRL
jgi:hypothetical protein